MIRLKPLSYQAMRYLYGLQNQVQSQRDLYGAWFSSSECTTAEVRQLNDILNLFDFTVPEVDFDGLMALVLQEFEDPAKLRSMMQSQLERHGLTGWCLMQRSDESPRFCITPYGGDCKLKAAPDGPVTHFQGGVESGVSYPIAILKAERLHA